MLYAFWEGLFTFSDVSGRNVYVNWCFGKGYLSFRLFQLGLSMFS